MYTIHGAKGDQFQGGVIDEGFPSFPFEWKGDYPMIIGVDDVQSYICEEEGSFQFLDADNEGGKGYGF